MILVFIYCFFSTGFAQTRRFLESLLFQNPRIQSAKYRAFDAVFFALDTLLRYSVMVLMMTMNGWVNIVIALGMMVGYMAFGMDKEGKDWLK